MPYPEIMLSVSNIVSLPESDIWTLGDTVGLARNRAVKARGEFLESDVVASNLTLVNAEPPERHFHILGWEANEKPKQKLQAQLLAPKLVLVIR
jgi:hypothetical protein